MLLLRIHLQLWFFLDNYPEVASDVWETRGPQFGLHAEALDPQTTTKKQTKKGFLEDKLTSSWLPPFFFPLRGNGHGSLSLHSHFFSRLTVACNVNANVIASAVQLPPI